LLQRLSGRQVAWEQQFPASVGEPANARRVS
jgi:hypothetical protein